MPKNPTTLPARAQADTDLEVLPAADTPALSSSAPAIQGEPVAYKGERVLTTEMAAASFEVDGGRLTNNFDRNRSRFEEGKHFYRVTGTELREMKNQPSLRGLVAPQASHLILWTERGIARHAKMLETDTAWEVYETLEDTYFHAKEAAVAQAPAFQVPTTLREALLLAAAQEEEIERHRAVAHAATAKAAEMERRKAEIGGKREATAMATASAAKREADKLKIQLDRSNEYATVKRMEIAFGRKFPWQPLKKTSLAMGLAIETVDDPNFNTVKSYHALAWREAYGVEVPGWTGSDLDGEAA